MVPCADSLAGMWLLSWQSRALRSLLGPVGEMLDEVLHLRPSGIAERLDGSKVDWVGLHRIGIELMLANGLAESIANPRTGGAPVAICRLRQHLGLRTRSGLAG
jgi:hypothetical protein